MDKINLFKNGYPFSIFSFEIDDSNYDIVVDNDKRLHNIFINGYLPIEYKKFKEKANQLLKANKGSELIFGIGYAIDANDHYTKFICGYKGVFPYLLVPSKNNKKRIFPICMDKAMNLYYCCDTSKIVLTLSSNECLSLNKKLYLEDDGNIFYFLKFVNSPLITESDFIQYRMELLNKMEGM